MIALATVGSDLPARAAPDTRRGSGQAHNRPRLPRPTQVPEPVRALREEVEEFASQFPTIGFEKADMRYQA